MFFSPFFLKGSKVLRNYLSFEIRAWNSALPRRVQNAGYRNRKAHRGDGSAQAVRGGEVEQAGKVSSEDHPGGRYSFGRKKSTPYRRSGDQIKRPADPGVGRNGRD